MKIYDIIKEDGRIVKGVNTTVDVGADEIKKQAAKFGNTVDKDGRPPTLSSKVKGSSTNVLFNMGLAESLNLADSQDMLAEAVGEIASATEIYVDMDGVLADFFGEWAKLMNVDHFTDIGKQHDINDALQKIRDTDDFWLKLPILPEAKNLLNLIKQVRGEYSICTSPLADDPNSEKHKRTWVEKNLAFFPPKEVHVTHDKPQFATAKDGTPNILIDDYGVNINSWEAAGGIGFKYKDHKFERTAKDIKQHIDAPVDENFADGKVKGKSKPGRVKKSGASCNGSVTDLRARAKKASGEKAKMLHWCANMKSGRS
jgi:5'(3')-deoxyribonucleotidase